MNHPEAIRHRREPGAPPLAQRRYVSHAQQGRHRAALDAELLARMVRAVASTSGLAAWRWVQ